MIYSMFSSAEDAMYHPITIKDQRLYQYRSIIEGSTAPHY
jgi:hypothetical protein